MLTNNKQEKQPQKTTSSLPVLHWYYCWKSLLWKGLEEIEKIIC